MLIPVITLGFFLFGWWIYFAFQNGPGITGGLKPAPWAEPFSPLMGPHLGGSANNDAQLTDEQLATWPRLNGVFWAAFLLFSWTAGSILSGAVIERIRAGAFWVFGTAGGLYQLGHRRLLGLVRCRLDGARAGIPRRLCVGGSSTPWQAVRRWPF